MTPRVRIRLALALLVLAAGAVRLAGIDFLLPHWREQDAQLVQHLRFQRTGAADEGSGFRNAYPYLLPHLLRLSPGIRAEREELVTLDDHLDAVSAFYVETRVWIALLSLLAVPATFAIARRFVGARGALFATALAAASLLTQTFAQQARPHGAASSFFLLAVAAALRLREKPTPASYALAGGAAALALGALHSGVFVLASGLAAHFAREGPRKPRDHLRLAIPAVVAAAALPLFYPFFFPSLTGAGAATLGGEPDLKGEDGGLRFGRHAIQWQQFDFGGARTLLETFAIYETGLCVLLALAVAALAMRRSQSTERAGRHGALFVVLAFVVPYALVLAAFEDTFDRFALPLVPFAAVFAAWGVERMLEGRSKPLRATVASLAGLALLLQAFACAKLAWLRARPDTMELATAWIQGHASPERDVLFVAPSLELTLARTDESLSREQGRKIAFSRWAKYQTQIQGGRRGTPLPPPRWDVRYLGLSRELGFPSAAAIADEPERYLRALGPGLYVVNTGRSWGHPSETRVVEQLRAAGRLELRAAPHASGRWADVGLEFQPMDAASAVLGRVLAANSIGPPVEVYRFAPP